MNYKRRTYISVPNEPMYEMANNKQ